MKELHSTLPFTEPRFFTFLFIGVAILLLFKLLFSRLIAYKYVLAVISLSYLALFFTKPLQIIGLILYTYLIYFLFSKVLYYKKLLLPVILLSLPMLFMKTLNILPTKSPGILYQLSVIFQVAGISFMTFKVIQLYIDESSKPVIVSFVDFFNFAAFVPTLLIGPIDRFGRFNADVKDGYVHMQPELFVDGINDLIKGLLYKFIFAYGISVFFLERLENDGSVLFHAQNMYV